MRADEPADRSFIARATSIHEGQRDLARLTERKSGDARVRRLGARIDRDHHAALARLRALGVERDFFPPGRLQDPEVRRFKRLDSVGGAAFDRRGAHVRNRGRRRQDGGAAGVCGGDFAEAAGR